MAYSYPWRNYPLGSHLARRGFMALFSPQSERLVHRFITDQLSWHLTHHLLTWLQTKTQTTKHRSHKNSQER